MAPSILPLRVGRLRFSVGNTPLLHDLSFELDGRQRTVILGPNGSGKTLLLRLCHGLLRPTGGRIRWADEAAARASQAMVFERPLMLRRPVADNIAYPLALRGLPRGERRPRVEEALAATGLTQLAARPARCLSAGEQKRLALARALVCDPQVLFLDEPTANLDPGASRVVEEIIANIGSGTKVIMTTHNLAQARRLADDILFLHHGRLLAHQKAPEFFSHPCSEETAAFIEGNLSW